MHISLHSSIIFFFTCRKSIFAAGNPHSNFGIECINVCNIHGRRNLMTMKKEFNDSINIPLTIIVLTYIDKKCKRIICESSRE